MSAIAATASPRAGGASVYVPYALGGETVEVAEVPGHPDRRRLVKVECGEPGADHAVLPAFRRLRRLRHPALGRRAISRAGSARSWSMTLAQAGIACATWRPGRRPRPRPPRASRYMHGWERMTCSGSALRRPARTTSSRSIAARFSTRISTARLRPPWAIAEPLISAGKPLDIQITATNSGLDVDVRGSGAAGYRNDRERCRASPNSTGWRG